MLDKDQVSAGMHCGDGGGTEEADKSDSFIVEKEQGNNEMVSGWQNSYVLQPLGTC